MKEHPLLCNERTVKAILAGTQTQDRRPVVPQPRGRVISYGNWQSQDDGVYRWMYQSPEEIEPGFVFNSTNYFGNGLSPWQPGDHLYVRETWAYSADCEHYNHLHGENKILYRADNPVCIFKWRPSIHMPKWASRITIEVLSVRVERVQDISEKDAIAEGVNPMTWINHPEKEPVYRVMFWSLWDSLYAQKGYGWTANPWVWATEFRVLKK